MVTIFVCDPETAFYRELERQNVLDDQWWIEQLDQDEDEELRIAHDPEVDEWPWWLPPAHEVEEPEVIEDACGVLVDDDNDREMENLS